MAVIPAGSIGIVSIQLLFLFNFYTWCICENLYRVSIQLLFLFNPYPFILRKIITFQYSFCSYSTISTGHNYGKRIVSIQLLFLFNFALQSKALQENIVSIQLLFLFNEEAQYAVDNVKAFQYSFCSYST